MLERIKGLALLYGSSVLMFSFGSIAYGDGAFLGASAATALFIILFIPGYLISELMFPTETDILERIAYSIGLGFAFFPILLYYLNQAGLLLTKANILLALAGGYIFFAIAFLAKNKYRPGKITD
jgi:uncharacterized membrane protein